MTAPTLEKILSVITDYSKTMGSLHNDFLEIVFRDIKRFEEETASLSQQMQWQGWTTLALTTFSASLSVAGAMIPKTPGLADRMQTNDFLRSFCKTGAKFFTGVNQFSDAGFRSTTTKIESKRALLERVNLQDGQAKKSLFDQHVQQAQSAALRILESKARGG